MQHVEIMRWGRARALRAVALRRKGLTFREIGEKLGGVSDDRARYLVYKGERHEDTYRRVAADKQRRDRWERVLRLKPEFITPEDSVGPY